MFARRFGTAAAKQPSRHAVPIEHTDTVLRVEQMLQERDARGIIEEINLRTPFRFTSISRFDPPMLRGIYLYDRAHKGTIPVGSQILDDSFAAFVRKEKRPFWTEDSMMDPRLISHPARVLVRSYVAAPIRKIDGPIWGVIAHFDKKPRKIEVGEAELLLEIAGLLANWLFPDNGRASA
jgi:GAF domain-containing protein